VGSTLVDQQLREIRDAPNASDRCRPKQQSTWATPRSRSDMDQSVFRIYKGIKCFDFCKSHNVIATGGMSPDCTTSQRYTELHQPVISRPTIPIRVHCVPKNRTRVLWSITFTNIGQYQCHLTELFVQQ